jgi:hypothetical protein
MATSFAFQPIVTSGLVLCLDAANNKSYSGTGNIWYDLSSNLIDGTLTPGSSGLTFSSYNGGSIIFDGVDDYVINTNLSNFNVGSINIWFRPSSTITSTSSTSTLLQLRHGATIGSGWYIQLGSCTSLLTNEYLTILDLVSGRRTGLTDGGSFSSNTWYNLAFNFESTQYQIYINGLIKASTSSPSGISLLTNPNRLVLGAGTGEGIGSPFDFLDGSLSIIQLYNRTLSASEILQNYNAVKQRYFTHIDFDVRKFLDITQISDENITTALNLLVIELKNYKIWDKMRAIYPVVGGTSFTHKFNLKDPRDADSAFRLLFTNASGGNWVHSSTGMTPNGSTDFANTYFTPSVSQAGKQNNHHISFYSRTNQAGAAAIEIGTSGDPSTGINGSYILIRFTDNLFYGRINTTTNTTVSNSDSRGFYVSSRLSSTTQTIYKNGVGTSGSSNSTGLSSNSINIGRWNNPGGTFYYSSKQCAFASIGDGLTDTESSNFYLAVQNFQTRLGRNV